MDLEAHRREVEGWREGRYAALRRDLGWLTLAGLDWLKPGSNRVGTSADADVRVRIGPAEVGVIEVGEGGAIARGAWRHEGRPIDSLALVDDAEGAPTLLELGPLRQCVIRRGERLAVRTWDLESPAREMFHGIPHWPIDPAWCLVARLDPAANRTVAVPDVLGTVEDQPSPGDVVFSLDGREHRLQAVRGGDAGELWLIFGDATSGAESYGGGRYLYTDAPAADGTVTVDFNRAYNPPCVFSPYATCPVPWPANRLPIRVEAGELAYQPARTPEGSGGG
jgi:uncharacterized protein